MRSASSRLEGWARKAESGRWAAHRSLAPSTRKGTITTVAGTGAAGYSGNGGQATSAMLRGPIALQPTSDGGFYVAELLGG